MESRGLAVVEQLDGLLTVRSFTRERSGGSWPRCSGEEDSALTGEMAGRGIQKQYSVSWASHGLLYGVVCTTTTIVLLLLEVPVFGLWDPLPDSHEAGGGRRKDGGTASQKPEIGLAEE